MAVHVTHCPHCQTSFRVRDEHLNAARGMVRCGSCLQVFKAAEHFIQEGAAAAVAVQPKTDTVKAPAARPASKPAASQPAIEEDDDDTGLIHDDMDDDPISDTLADDPFTDFNLRAPEKQKRPKPRIELEMDDSIFSLRNVSNDTLDFSDMDAEDEGKIKDDDESWANALLNDDDDSIRQMKEEKVTSSRLKLSGNDEFNFDLPPPEEDDFHGFLDDEDDTDQHHNRNDFTLGGDDGLQTETLEISLPASSIAGLQEEPLQLAKKRKHLGVDLFSNDPDLKEGYDYLDALHLSPTGYRQLAVRLARRLGIAEKLDLQLGEEQVQLTIGSEAFGLGSPVRTKRGLRFDLAMDRLPATGSPFLASSEVKGD